MECLMIGFSILVVYAVWHLLRRYIIEFIFKENISKAKDEKEEENT